MSTLTTQDSHYVFVIENTGNADFVMRGRRVAIADKLRSHSDAIKNIEGHDSFESAHFPLFDGNGNRIGFFLTTTPVDGHIELLRPIVEESKISSRPFVLVFDMRNDAFKQNGYSNEIAYVLRQAADSMEQACDEAQVNDSNGARVGNYTFYRGKSPANEAEDKITETAFDSTIYKIDPELIQDHAMYVVPIDDYELGYGEVGQGYLFAANGDIADIVEINDNMLSKLDKSELISLEKACWLFDKPDIVEAHERLYLPAYEPSEELGF